MAICYIIQFIMEITNIRETVASLALIAGSVGGVGLPQSVELVPLGAQNIPSVTGVFLRDEEPGRQDTNGQPFNPPSSNSLSNNRDVIRTFPIRRVYGRKGYSGSRVRGYVSPGLR